MPPIQYIARHELPERLKRVLPIVKKLYCRGNLPSLDNYKCLAVVGSRKHSEYGERACKELIRSLSGYPIIIVSGLALGIDSIAHEAALEHNLLTIALPGSCLEEKKIYPPQKQYLARKILDRGGCLLSEYAPEDITGSWVFPQRNRIMAGLADAVLIIEAARRSGTSITAHLALDYNKDVLAVPGSIFSPLSEGPHFLLEQGARPIYNARGIVEALGLDWKEETQQEKYTDEEHTLISLLPCTRDHLIHALKKPAHEVQMRISLLEIKGLIKEVAGNIHVV